MRLGISPRLYKLAAFLLVLPMLFASVTPTPRAQAQTPAGAQKLLVDASDKGALETLRQSGAQLLVDYGAFSLWRTNDVTKNTLAVRPTVTARDDFDTITMRRNAFSPLAGTPQVANGLQQQKGSGDQLWLVQFVGPVKGEWLADLNGLGLEIVSYVPSNAYLVWGDGAALSRLDTAQTKNPLIQWNGPFHPEYRIAPQLKDRLANSQAGQPAPGGQKPDPADAKPATDTVDVTVQFYATKHVQASVEALLKLGGEVRLSPSLVLNYVNVSLALPADQVTEVANWPDVVNVEPWVAPRKLDEVQNQILAGNIVVSGTNRIPAGPGYLAWLASKGFPTTPSSYPIVDVVDDGLDLGNAASIVHPDFYEFGSTSNPDRVTYIENCTADATGNAVGGHGNLNAAIVAGFNNSTGFPYTDTLGYNRGLGVSPYGRVAGTKNFSNAGPFDISGCSNSIEGLVARSYDRGANFTSNSWGAPVGGAYTSDSQAYDALSRDARATVAGNQQMLHIFSAGNKGSGANTIGSPGTAKNVLTVGATENVRDEGIADGCGSVAANNADDIASFSSRGPTDDTRVKPDIQAPGIHIQAAASQDPGYNGTGVCGAGTGDQRYYPAGQTLYTWSSGTSHSAPAVAGAASLAWEYYGRVLQPGKTPSPAMLKALLLNTTRYLTGVSANDTLPSNSQGWGDANIGTLTDGTARVFYDQKAVLNTTGAVISATGTVSDVARPVRVTLVWTDAPGPTFGAAYVNNLDLEVTVGGNTYKGNVFSGANSIVTGTADVRNNVENVFLPAGVSGPITVRVIATNIAGDGVPGNPDTTDQDFALILSNVTATSSDGTITGTVRDATTNQPIAGALVEAATGGGIGYQTTSAANGAYTLTVPGGVYTMSASLTNYLSVPVSGVTVVAASLTTQNLMLQGYPQYQPLSVVVTDPDANNDGIVAPGEIIRIDRSLTNIGTLTDTGATSRLEVLAGQAVMIAPNATYPTIGINQSGFSTTPYQAIVGLNQKCPDVLTFRQAVTPSVGPALVSTFDVPVGRTYAATGLPVTVPDGSGAGVAIPITITNAPGLLIEDLNVLVSVNHTFDSDLALTLTSPSGISVTLVNLRGGSGDNFNNTVFDDSAATAISAGSAPFAGSFRPETPLSVLNGQPISGTWRLSAFDRFAQDVGTVQRVVLMFGGSVSGCAPNTAQSAILAGQVTDVATSAPVSGSVVSTALGAGGTMTATSAADGSYRMALPVGTFTVTASHPRYVTTPGASISTSAGATTTLNIPLTGFPRLIPAGMSFEDSTFGNGNGRVDPGEIVGISLPLTNTGTLTATTTSGSLAVVSGLASLAAPTALYPTIGLSASAANVTPYVTYVDPLAQCGDVLTFRQVVTTNFGVTSTQTTTMRIGLPTAPLTMSQSYSGPPVFISPTGTPTVLVPFTVTASNPTIITDVDVRVNITHTFDGDLRLTLIAPDGTNVLLSNGHGFSGDNYTNTIFDDEAATPIVSGTVPFTGRFRPDALLSALDTKPISGTWTLKVEDNAGGDGGNVLGFGLDFQYLDSVCQPVPALAVPGLTQVSPLAKVIGSPDFTMVVTGSNFYDYLSGVRWNNTPLSTTFVTSGTLQAFVPASLVAPTLTKVGVGLNVAAGPVTITVQTVSVVTPSNALTLDVQKADQTITFGPLSTKTVGDAPFVLSATASSTLTVTFSVSASPAGACSLAGNVVTVVAPGTCTVTASQPGNVSFNPAPSAPQQFTILAAPTATPTPTATATPGTGPGTVSPTPSPTATPGGPTRISLASSMKGYQPGW